MKKKIIKSFYIVILLISTLTVLFSSILNLYEKRSKVLNKLGILNVHGEGDHHNEKRFLVNPLKKSKRQIPPANIKDLKINKNSDIYGQWTAPIDWNVQAVHAVLLPSGEVMTFGTFGIEKKEDKDIRANKDLILTNGFPLERDGGSHQWHQHDINSGIDFDIWDPEKGVNDESHIFFKNPVVMDAFCSVVRIIDKNKVFIVGGNVNQSTNYPDTQHQTMLYDVQDKEFKLSKNLNYERWYGSVVITGDQKMIIFGGRDNSNGVPSIIPEIINLKSIDEGWKPLVQSKSNDLFGNQDAEEWSYPRAYLASDGNIVGISYNKTWVMDLKDNFRVTKTGEIPLVESGISKLAIYKNPNYPNMAHTHKHTDYLKLLTIGSPVGTQNSTLMIDENKIIVFGGKQEGDEYSPSNRVFLIDFSNSFKPIFQELKSMKFARGNADATIMPDGNIFINGGSSSNSDLEFSVFTPEIYNPNTQVSKIMDKAYMRRNYHSVSLLLKDGRILTAGGDVWNAEIFYPPYLFTKDVNNNTVLAKRPEIVSLKKEVKRGEKININVKGDVSKVSLISTGSTTHSQGSESKFRNIKFKKISESKIEIKLDDNPNNIQNGNYLLFVLDSKGTPSEGEIIFVN